MRTLTTGALCSLSLAVSMSVAAPAWSQEKVGVVTAVVGPVTVARTSTPPEPLKFKDDIFTRDRVTTGENAITRILFGGKVIVTARERSTLTISEVPGLSTIELPSGRIAVAVDRTRMKPGERVEVRTPSAIAGVRGTVFIVEAHANTSTVTVLRGLVDVVRVDPSTGQVVGPVTPVGKNQTVSVRKNVLPTRPQAIAADRADALSKEFTPPVRPIAATTVMPVKDEVARATSLLNALVPPAAPTPSDRAVATSSGSITAPVSEAPAAGGDPSRPTVTAAPGASTAPTVTTSAPAASTPATVATAPVAAVTAPAAAVTAPVTAVTAPVAAVTAPVTAVIAPVTAVIAPVTAVTTPVLAVVTPVVSAPTALVPTLTVAPAPAVPAVVPSTTGLIPAIVQPVVQTVVVPILQPVIKLLR
jgi:hypothetical protein